MKKVFSLLACFLILSVAGCSNPEAEQSSVYSSSEVSSTSATEKVTSATEASTEISTAQSTTAEPAEIPAPADNYGYDGIDLSALEIIDEYEVDDYFNSVIAKWQAELNAQKLNSSIGYSIMGEYVFVEKLPEEYLGETDFIIMNEDNFHVLSDIANEGNPIMFVYNDDLYIYDYYLKNGIMHSFYNVYDLGCERMISSYSELYNLGDPSEPFQKCSKNSKLKNFDEVYKDIVSKTDKL